ncbi:electron transport complex subunit E [Buchnera aphidicola (Muscaphis stroyani)]|uniref:Ion-translocating oxidoreductase complex subunit E n=1 Tax=Buchnera aphidicola (Muscaphis stroyani) TaxID=1241869 RepID=A0A4D6Y541_9GAMM|nr:electron transport complex subunit E [Buchnera aphidicola]QCI24219.1 electron transport complex subunit E [Buchnera aphidicola (Muscaphis stroyani)]
MNVKQFLNEKLWKNNSSLVQLLGLCPVLSITTSAIDSIALGIATTLVLMITNTTVSIFKFFIPKDIRIPIYMMIISSVVTCIEMLLHAYAFELYKSLGIFIPLIVTNCVIVGRADMFAYQSSVLISFLDGLFIGLGSTFFMFLIGSIREILGQGTWFFGIYKIFSALNDTNYFTLIEKNSTIILAILPPGGFIILGFVIALKNFIDYKILKNNTSSDIKCPCKNKIN